MNILIAPNSYKGSLTAFEAALAIEKGVKKIFPGAKTVKAPLADGGDGTMEIMVSATGGKIRTAKVTGPLNHKITAKYGVSGNGKTFFLEMAEASGLKLVPEKKRNPMLTTTRGVGELINIAMHDGARKIVLGIGGSATNDGGAGLAAALGYKLLNRNGKEIAGGGFGLVELDRIENIEILKKFKKLEIIVACDVNNLLCGNSGASRIFGPQKGAGPAMVEVLDKALLKYAKIIKRDLGVNVFGLKGGGAAGGLGAGLFAFTGARLQKGINIVMGVSNIEEKIKNADLVITGEGQIDTQTLFGKVPVGVALLAKKYRVPVLCLAGKIGDMNEKIYSAGISAIVPLVDGPVTLEFAMKNASALLTEATARTFRIIKKIKLRA